MSETKADTTSMGLFFISFLMFVLIFVGFFGFSDSMGANFAGTYAGSQAAAGILALGFLFITFAMWKGGNKLVMIIFGLLTAFSYLYATVAIGALNMEYLFIVIAIMLIILAFVVLANKAGFMLTLLLICSALVFLFYGLVAGAMNSGNDPKTFLLCIGIFALLSFILSVWMALADNTDVGLPVM